MASTNSLLLNTCISSICSPIPIYLIGILFSSTIPITTPPFAVPSNLVRTNPVTLLTL